MNDDELNRALDTANGFAIYAGFSQAALWLTLVKNGAISKDQAKDVLDGTLLVLERNQETRPGGGPGAVVNARGHFESLIKMVSKLPES